MIIVPTYTSNVTNSAPAGFIACAQRVISFLQSQYTNLVRYTILIDYAATGGPAATSTYDFVLPTYAQLRTALIAKAVTVNAIQAANSLPGTDPTGGGTLGVPKPQALALGLATDSGNTACTFSSGISWDTDNINGVTSGLFDLEGIMFHEFTEPMGRIKLGGAAGSQYEPLDLFSYTSAGTRNFNSRGGYFSIDNGTTNLSTPSIFAVTGDPGDWDNNTADACNTNVGSGGELLPFSEYDRIIMDVMGWQRTSNPSNVAVSKGSPRQRF